MPSIPIQVIGNTDAPKVSVRIERMKDGKFYDPAAKQFKDLANVSSPYIPLEPRTGVGNAGIARADVPITSQFTEGRYTIYYHDASSGIVSPAFTWTEFDIFRGDYQPLNTTDIVWRLLDARATDKTTMRQAFGKLDAIYDWVSKQPGFVAP